jgi:hypothetical protein
MNRKVGNIMVSRNGAEFRSLDGKRNVPGIRREFLLGKSQADYCKVKLHDATNFKGFEPGGKILVHPSIYIYIYIYGSTALLLEFGCFFSFLVYTQSVGLLGRRVSSSQGRYLHTKNNTNTE